MPQKVSPVILTSRRVIKAAYAAVALFDVLREISVLKLPAVLQRPELWLNCLGVGTAVALFLAQPESLRQKLGIAAAAMPVILALGVMAGAYIIYAGFAAEAFTKQAAFCAVGTILLGEVWIVNQSVSRDEAQTTPLAAILG